MSRHSRQSLKALASVLVLLLVLGSAPAAAQSGRPAFAVTSTVDAPDDAPGNGSALCDIGAYEQQTALR